MRPSFRLPVEVCRRISNKCPCNAPRTFACGRWSSSSATARQWSTPLAKSLAEAITTTGPISVAAYMRQCLTSPDSGYYTAHTEGRDQFGQKGDFVTSPEISQVFGELIGIWVLAEWMSQGKMSSGVQLVEVGPGRGTLMDDMLRTIRNFKPLASSIDAIYLVEASPSLREAQRKLLCGDAPIQDIEYGYQSTCKYSECTKIIWYDDIKFVPQAVDKSPFIIAHEFFDALPIHVFQSVTPSPTESSVITSTTGTSPTRSSRLPQTNQWRELLVAPTRAPDRFSSTSSKESIPEFQLILPKSSTPHSLYLPSLSPRYTALLPTSNAVIEISPSSLSTISTIATLIGGANPTPKSPPKSRPTSGKTVSSPQPPPFQKPHPSGAALIIDYGPASTIPTHSLRGIRAHKPCSPFTSPGLVDISADVDFVGLADAAISASPGVEVHGPVEQGTWLRAMGGAERVDILVKGVAAGKDGDGAKERIEGAWRRLVDRGPQGMGRLYKVMAIVPHVEGREGRRPVGFGGEVVG
ncbi:DUF185-domain-containing protein [Patellaria atrata CBS 101060]|uniref:Protein arginine methyltransferase NDUFAF7 n=1 Tax=Patellaria atrata CBS 101060 TaxID=1346257 RepID=A0A9P4SJU2_9PEZI|nr:DUF185-domain-containing protein [Patellaria atrata CBS 101060]